VRSDAAANRDALRASVEAEDADLALVGVGEAEQHANQS
jgi:DNA-binding transcriptional regulator LsrR (DeoR family)